MHLSNLFFSLCFTVLALPAYATELPYTQHKIGIWDVQASVIRYNYKDKEYANRDFTTPVIQFSAGVRRLIEGNTFMLNIEQAGSLSDSFYTRTGINNIVIFPLSVVRPVLGLSYHRTKFSKIDRGNDSYDVAITTFGPRVGIEFDLANPKYVMSLESGLIVSSVTKNYFVSSKDSNTTLKYAANFTFKHQNKEFVLKYSENDFELSKESDLRLQFSYRF